MTSPETENPEAVEPIAIASLLGPLIRYRRLLWQGSLAAVVIAALLGALYFVAQPTSWSSAMGFGLAFDGADTGLYPNKTRFAASDITAPSVVAEVFEANSVSQYCSVEHFRAGFVVAESSPDLQFLRLEYQARLSDSRLSLVERQRLQDEFVSRRATLPKEYQLLFVRNVDCGALPDKVVLKSMADVLNAWAHEAQDRRGALRARVPVLTENVFTPSKSTDPSLLVQADLVRSAIDRVIESIKAVQAEPGADLIRVGEGRIGLLEVRLRLEDLRQTQLDPLIASAGRGFGRESQQYVTQAFATASIRLAEAERRVEAYRHALREYSGMSSAPSTDSSGTSAQRPSDVQALTPQIDRTFIEGIVELSTANTEFRQEITRNAINASIEAARLAAVVEHYRELKANMNAPREASKTPDQIREVLSAVVADAKDATRQFNQLYEEFSRVAFRAGPNLYRVTEPPTVTKLRTFDLRDLVGLVLGVAVVAPIILAVLCLALFYVRKYVAGTLSVRSVRSSDAG